MHSKNSTSRIQYLWFLYDEYEDDEYQQDCGEYDDTTYDMSDPRSDDKSTAIDAAAVTAASTTTRSVSVLLQQQQEPRHPQSTVSLPSVPAISPWAIPFVVSTPIPPRNTNNRHHTDHTKKYKFTPVVTNETSKTFLHRHYQQHRRHAQDAKHYTAPESNLIRRISRDTYDIKL